MNGGLPQPPGGFDPYGPQFQEDPNRQQQMAALPSPQAVAPPPPDASTLTLGGATGGQLPVLPGGRLPANPDEMMQAATQTPSTNPMVNQFNQYVQALMPQVMAAQRSHLPETSKPGIWANILTWGGANIAHHQREAAYNAGVDNYNQQLKLYAMDLAKDMVNEQAKAAQLAGTSNIAQQRLQIQQDTFGLKLQEEARRNAEREYKLRTGQLHKGPPTAEQMIASKARNKRWVESEVPGYFEEVDIGGGGGVGGNLPKDANGNFGLPGMPAAPGSPAADPTAAAPAEDEVDRLAKLKGQQKEATTLDTASTRTRQETAGKVLGLIAQARKELAAAETSSGGFGNLGKGVGPGASRYRNFWAAGVGRKDPVFMAYKDTTGLLHTLLMSMHTGSRGSEMLKEHFEAMGQPEKQSAENMRALFDTAERYAQIVDKHQGQESADELDALGAPTRATSNTPTSSTTTTSGALQGGSASGLEGILQKHGY